MTNGGGDSSSIGYQMTVFDKLPPRVRRALRDAPINLGAATIARWLSKYDEAEVAAMTEQTLRAYMLGNDSESTRAKWRGMTGPHPQIDPEYPNANYQLVPRPTQRTRVVNLRGLTRRR